MSDLIIRHQQLLLKLLIHGLNPAEKEIRISKAALVAFDASAPLRVYVDKISGAVLFSSGDAAVPSQYEPVAMADDGEKLSELAGASGSEHRDIVNLINLLREDEGDSVAILCDNNGDNDLPNCAVEVCADWTGWEPSRFGGNTLGEALRNAADTRNAAIGGGK